MNQACQFVSESEQWRCLRCGRVVRARVSSAPVAVCRPAGARPGLGDMVAAGLSAVGITKERVSAVLGRPCSCPRRQEALNKLGAKYLGIGVDNK